MFDIKFWSYYNIFSNLVKEYCIKETLHVKNPSLLVGHTLFQEAYRAGPVICSHNNVKDLPACLPVWSAGENQDHKWSIELGH